LNDEEMEKNVNNCFEMVFNEIESSSAAEIFIGLTELETLFQICRTFNIESKILKTEKFKKYYTLQREKRHWFQVSVHEEVRKTIKKIKELEN